MGLQLKAACLKALELDCVHCWLIASTELHTNTSMPLACEHWAQGQVQTTNVDVPASGTLQKRRPQGRFTPPVWSHLQ